jgi:glycosyltransferase involved in cell wall biosynthesis
MNRYRQKRATNLRFDFIFVHPHLKFGGAEKHSVLVANEMVNRGYKVAFFLHSKTGGLMKQLDSRIELFGSKSDSHFLIPWTAFLLNRFLEKVDKTEVVVRLWSSALAVGLVANNHFHNFHFYEDLDPREHSKYISFGRLKQSLIRKIYTNAESLIANTRSTAQGMREIYGLESVPKVIYPCIDISRALELDDNHIREHREGQKELSIVTVGSLVPRKGLLWIARELGNSKIKIKWTVIGEGPLLADIESICEGYENLELHYVGTKTNPFLEMSKCSILVHGAESESFGLVIVEALAIGLEVVAAESPGPQEILELINRNPKLKLVSRSDGSLAADLIQRFDGINNSQATLSKEFLTQFSPEANVTEWELVCGRK